MKRKVELVKKTTNTILNETEEIVDSASKELENAVAPIRKTVFMRFPILFLLTVTFGVTATLLGMEGILTKYQVLANNPWLMFFLGIGILVLTGTLYKKLQ